MLAVMNANVAKFSPDGNLVLAYSWGGSQPDSTNYVAQLLDGHTGTLVASLSGHTSNLNNAVFSPDGTRVLTSSDDKTARLWRVVTGQPLSILSGHTDKVTDAQFSAGGDLILTNSIDGTVRLWNASTGALRFTLNVFTPGSAPGILGPVPQRASAMLSPDGSLVLTWIGNKVVRLWRASTGESLANLEGSGDSVDTSFSPDGSRIVTAVDNTARLWDGRTGAPHATLAGHSDKVRTASFSPDGSRLLTTSEDFSPRLWDGKTGAIVATLWAYRHGLWKFRSDSSVV